MTVVLQDAFTDTNSTSLDAHTMDVGSGWTEHVGAWEIQSNAARGPDTTADALASADAGEADVTITVDVNVPNNSTYALGPAGRVVDASNYWVAYAERDGSTAYLRLVEYTSGAGTIRAEDTFAVNPAGSTITITLALSGTSLTATASTGETCNYTSSQHQSATRHGLWSYTDFGLALGSFDNFEVDDGGGGGALTAGTLSVTDTSADSVSLSITAATGGTAPYTYQLERAPDSSGSPGSYSTVGSPQSGTTWEDDDGGSGLAAGTYWYRVEVTDDATDTDYSNEVDATVEEGGGDGTTLGTLITSVGYNSLAFHLPFTGNTAEDNTCAVRFRTPASTGDWVEWPNFVRLDDGVTKMFRGAFCDLDEDTEYEYELTITDAAGVTGTNPVTGTLTTKANPDSPDTVRGGTITYYVDCESGSDSNNGTSSGTPFATLYKAVTTANAVGGSSEIVILLAASSVKSYVSDDFTITRDNITIIGEVDAVDDDRAVTAGARCYVEYCASPGNDTHTAHVSGPSGASSTYPQVTEEPWTVHDTFTDTLSVNRTVYKWASFPFLPKVLGYAANRFDLPKALGYWKNPGGVTLSAWIDLLADNPEFHSGAFYSGGDLYLVMPDNSDPNTQYITIGKDTILGIAADNVRVSGLVFRAVGAGIGLDQNAHDAVIDHCDFQHTWSSVFILGDKSGSPHTYGSGHLIERNLCRNTNLWSATQVASPLVQDQTCIAWGTIKGTTTDGTTSIGTALSDSAESQAVFNRGGAHGVTFRHNTVDGHFNGYGSYNTEYDEWATFHQDIHHNLFKQVSDDTFEPENNASCWLIWRNRLEHVAVGISVGPVHYGPIYLIRNEFWARGASGVGRTDNGDPGVGACTEKFSGGTDPQCTTFWFHNSDWTEDVYNHQNSTSGFEGVGVDGLAKNAGGSSTQERFVGYNNFFRTTRYASVIPAPADCVEDGNYFVTTDEGSGDPRGLSFNDTTYRDNVAAYRSAYNSLTGRTNAGTNTLGDFVTVATLDAELEDPENGDLTPTSDSDLLGAGVVIPNFSVAYPGSGTVRIWHYYSDYEAPTIGALDVEPEGEPPATAVKDLIGVGVIAFAR